MLYRRALHRHLAATFETLAFQVSDKLDRSVYERYRNLQLAANLPAIRDSAASPVERRRVLDSLRETSADFAWIGLADASGRIIAATGRLFEGTPAETRPWFRGGREFPFIGPLHEMAELKDPAGEGESSSRVFDLSVPVTDATGQFGGVLAAQVRWNWARDVQLSVIPETAVRDQIGVTVYGASRDVMLDSGASGWTQPPDAPAVGESRRSRGSLVETAAGGTTYLTGYARSRGFREYRGIGWLTVVRQPVERAFAGVGALRRNIALWGGVLTLAGGVASWVLAGRHARRLRSMRAAAERIREGDILAVLPRPKGESEMAAMCGALGDLVEDLRAQREQLTTENARLAAELREGESAKP